jgi:4Fe-4S single cluster protein
MPTAQRFKSHPQSAPGDFYVANGECTSCGAPHAVAPDLIGWNDSGMGHCVWKQPETEAEPEQAFAAFEACCVGCYRYAGSDPGSAGVRCKILKGLDDAKSGIFFRLRITFSNQPFQQIEARFDFEKLAVLVCVDEVVDELGEIKVQ